MKREILFRGKRVDNGEWVYGYLFYTTFSTVKEVGLQPCIQVINDGIYYSSFEVMIETVGQYTGLNDNEGNKIFEGDILYLDENPCSHHLIFFDTESSRFTDERLEDSDSNTEYYGFDFVKDCHIIGNIHDNPELLK